MSTEKINSFINKIKKDGQQIVFSVISAWLLTLSGFSIFSPIAFSKVPDYNDSMNTLIIVLITVVASVLLYVMNKFWLKKSLFIILPLSFLLYGMVSVALSATNAAARGFSAFIFAALSLVVLVLCINYAKGQKIQLPTKDISSKASLAIVLSAFFLLSVYWSFLLWARTESFCSPCFDMGIFAQLYDNIVDPSYAFQPITTCERGEVLSHFAVHFSPILYLLAPFCFFVEPLPVLVIAQIVLVLSGVFPLYLICKEVKLSNFKTTLISLLFLIYPVMSSGSFYDFHENAFLAPLILWTLYFSHKKKWYHTLLMFLFALLVLMVKEDAAIYVAFISLYVFFGRKRYACGASMFVMTVAYFFFAIFMISQFQQSMIHGAEGNMLSSRYANIIGEEGGFSSLVKVLIVNPALYATESLTADKLIYILNMFLPLAFLPIITRKPSRWLLLGPVYVLNLVTDYPYQHDIGFQYSFGSGALLVYLAAVNLADLSDDAFFPPRQFNVERSAENEAGDAIDATATAKGEAVTVSESAEEATPVTVSNDNGEATAISCENAHVKNIKVRFISNLTAIGLVFAMFASLFIQAGRAPAHFSYARRYFTEGEIRSTVTDVLSRVDRDKSILASSMYLTHLYDADELYSTLQVFDSNNTIILFTDVVVLDLRDYMSDSKKAEIWTNKYLMNSYVITEEHEGIIRVLERTEDSPPTGYSKAYQEYLDSLREEANESENSEE